MKQMQAGVDKLATVVGITLGPKVCAPAGLYWQGSSSNLLQVLIRAVQVQRFQPSLLWQIFGSIADALPCNSVQQLLCCLAAAVRSMS